MKVRVQKYGGTSVASPQMREHVIGHVKEALETGYAVVVVVSAMGRKGDPYATDTLLGLLPEPEGGRETDLLISCGETISAVVMAKTLRKAGLPTVALNGPQAGIITDDHHGQARILKVHPTRVEKHLELGQVVVVAGFQGMSLDGEWTTLGRGGSDTSAVALGAALGAEEVEIFTDVEGIYTADPKLVPDARPLKEITYTEVCEMAHLGAKVIHPRAVEIAMQEGVPLHIRATTGKGSGTRITAHVRPEIEIVGDRVVTGVAQISGKALVSLTPKSPEGHLGVFNLLAEADISVDLINFCHHKTAFIIDEACQKQAGEVLAGLKDVSWEITPGFAKVSVVGAGMRGVPGVMARLVSGLQKAQVRIYQTTDSHASISCLVREDQMELAVTALHQAFSRDLLEVEDE